jgi:cobalamin biosynthesis protein CobT
MRDGSDAKGDTDASELEGDDEDGDGEGVEGDSASQSNGDIEGDDDTQLGPEEVNTLNTDLEDFEDDLDKLKDEIERKHDDALRGREYMPFSTEGDMVITIEDYIKKKGGRGRYERYSWTDNTRTFDRLKRELGPLNTIKAKICNLFNTRVASKWICDREQGKINNRVLARVKTGNRNVFREKYVSRETDTAISFLVDFSGSMSGSRLKSAMQAVIMFLETLQATKIKSEVLGYTTDGMCKGAVRGNYGRVENLVTYIIKDFNEPYNTKVKKRISNYQNVTLSQNCDPDNVKIAYDRLKARPERRKILFVLSDGEVANMGNTGLGIKYYRKLAKKIEREGIVEPIGVGLMCDAIKEFWTQTISINTSGTALAKGLFGELRKIFKV